MFYLDTSLLVAAFTHEPTTVRALSALKQTASGQFLISDWVRTEFAAALSIKIRTKQIDEGYRQRANALFAESMASSVTLVPVTTAHFREAERLAGSHELGLRAGDALHLAIASDSAATVWTLDRRMATAGLELGIATRIV